MSRDRLALGFLFSLILPFVFNPTLGTATYTTLYSTDRTSFSILVNGKPVSSKVTSLFVLPGRTVDLRAPSADRYVLKKEKISVPSPDGRWIWKVSDKASVSTFKIENVDTHESIAVNVFVMVPASRVKEGYLNRYRIGSYPKKPLKGMPMYVAPDGYVEVTAENKNLKVSPHFRLSQFLCKQTGSYPKYVVLQTRLLDKLESLLSRANESGHACETLHVMSGYRTPYYNRTLGNVAYSRHQWGDAADIFIDQSPRDGVMDDLNEDGKVDQADSRILAELVQNMDASEHELKGGVGSYKSTRSHGPFVHVDARGVSRTW